MHSSLRAIVESARYSDAEVPLDERAVVLSRAFYTKLSDWDAVARLKALSDGLGAYDILPSSVATTTALTTATTTVSSGAPTAEVTVLPWTPCAVGDVFDVDIGFRPATNYALSANITLGLVANGALLTSVSGPQMQLSQHTLRIVAQIQVVASTLGTAPVDHSTLLLARNDGSGMFSQPGAVVASTMLLVPFARHQPSLTVAARVTWASGQTPFVLRPFRREIIHRRPK